jgi:integrase
MPPQCHPSNNSDRTCTMAKGDAKALTAIAVQRMRPPPTGRKETFDAKVAGLFLRVTKTGNKSWGLDFRINGKRERLMLGSYPVVGLDDARAASMDALRAVRDGRNPAAEKRAAKQSTLSPDTFRAVADQFVERYAKKNNRSWRETERIFNVYVTPVWKDRPLADIRRPDLIHLLDRVEDKNGAVMADAVLAQVRKLFNWALDRSIIETTPIARVQRRTKPKERARKRWLDKHEIKAVWSAADKAGYPFGPFVKLLLLTGQRRSEVANMRWDEITNGVWTIPSTKTKNKQEHEVPLPQMAIDLLNRIPNTGDYVFLSGRSKAGNPISGFSKAKITLDRHINDSGESLEPWGYHDLRRTVRTHMSRLNVTSGVAERVINHTPQGVEAIYDRHGYLEEKRKALATWAASLALILNDKPNDNVVELEVNK